MSAMLMRDRTSSMSLRRMRPGMSAILGARMHPAPDTPHKRLDDGAQLGVGSVVDELVGDGCGGREGLGGRLADDRGDGGAVLGGWSGDGCQKARGSVDE